jgi:TPR repeat protein
MVGYEGEFSKNEGWAYRYAHAAAVSRLPAAEFAMGYYHEVGIGVEKDLEQARGWFEKAAANGNKDAARRLESLASRSGSSRKQTHS